MRDLRIAVTWSEDDDNRVESIAAQYRDAMLLCGIRAYTATRPDGTLAANRSGVIQFALKVLAGEITLEEDSV